MYKGKKIGVVVPAYNEERLVAQVLTTVPQFVDRVYAVNDAATDRTLEVMRSIARLDSRITVVNRERNGGVGAAIISGHKRALADGLDAVAVMAGDGQMDPDILPRILDPVVEGRADYAKGNRLSLRQNTLGMPAWRKLGNILLTHLTRVASGYGHLSDPQNGYTALSAEALQRLDLDHIEKGFAFENDLLVKLNMISARVVDVPHPSRYLGNGSKIRYHRFIARTSWVLLRDLMLRMRATRRTGRSSAKKSD